MTRHATERNMHFGFWTLFALMVGCASAPRVQQSPIPSPQSWQTKADAATPADALWWAAFNDGRLDSLVAQALVYNRDLHVAAARLNAARAQAKIAGAPLLPQLSGGMSRAERKQNFIGFPIPGQAEGEVLSNASTTYGLSVNASWEIDLWGRLGAGATAALANYQATRATYRGARMSLAAQTAKAWFAAIEAKRQLELARATYRNNLTNHEQVRARYERGVRPSLDARQSLSDLASSQDRLHQREQRFAMSIRQLELLIGRYPAGTFAIADALPPVPHPVPAGLPADLVSRRPDLIAVERRFAASQADHKAARRARYPRISLTASGGSSTDALGELLNGDFGVWSLIGNLAQPLFQGGRIQGNIDLTRAREREAAALFAQTVLQAYREVENALSAEVHLAKREAALTTAAEQARAARRLAENRYYRGLSDLLTVLQTRNAAYSTESQLLAVRRQRLDARIDLHLALGGGFEAETRARMDADERR